MSSVVQVLNLRRRLFIFLFGIYAGLTFVATHWPNLTLPLPGRPDLVAHMSLFGTWTIACTLAGVFGPALSEINIWRSAGVSLIYAGIDEGLQMIPAIRRVAALDDFGANTLGVMASAALLLLVSRAVARSR